ncbi:hypothetical protein CI741_06890 [Klebsiella pneumoniae subsp. pneumoniae]|nr:hypothetical protein CI741_06890 [Klebsiella pneumoniae subsp. pneumoniae]
MWCPLSSQEYQDLPDGAETTLTVNVRNDSVSQLARLGSLLGLDPLSRLRMTSGQKDPDDDGNEFDEFD